MISLQSRFLSSVVYSCENTPSARFLEYKRTFPPKGPRYNCCGHMLNSQEQKAKRSSKGPAASAIREGITCDVGGAVGVQRMSNMR